MTDTAGQVDVNNLKTEVDYRTRLQDIINRIYAAPKIDEIFIDLKDEIISLFEGSEKERFTSIDNVISLMKKTGY